MITAEIVTKLESVNLWSCPSVAYIDL